VGQRPDSDLSEEPLVLEDFVLEEDFLEQSRSIRLPEPVCQALASRGNSSPFSAVVECSLVGD
jgi:hypothetical protein